MAKIIITCEAVVDNLIRAVEAAGGVRMAHRRLTGCVAAPTGLALADIYCKACIALGRTPVGIECEEENED